MMAVAFLVATYVAYLRAKREGVPSQIVFDLSLYMLISGLLGARIFHIIQHIRSYSSFIDALKIWEGGLTYYGGFIPAVIVGVLYLYFKRVWVAKVADIVSPPLALGIGIGRIGCFLAGCCFGKPTSLPWGVIFPEGSPAWMVFGSQKVHPTQIYSSIFLLCVFVVLLLLRKKKFPGQLFLSFVIIYALYRFFIDFLRYYAPDERIKGFATSQIVSAAVGAIALMFMIVLIIRQRLLARRASSF